MALGSFTGKGFQLTIDTNSKLNWCFFISRLALKENKTTKRLILTKTKLKDMLEYEQVKETIKRISKMKEKSPNL